MLGLLLTEYGDPADTVDLVEVPDPGDPGPDEIVIDVEATPIQPTDLLMIAGTYGYLPPRPHLLGVEGVGRVSAVGRDVTHLTEGDRALVPAFTPSWVQRVKTNARWLRPLPDGDVHQLAMLGMNPLTAYVILTEFVALRAGQWLLQNGANSSVGRAVIPLAKARGIRTVNVVRRPELVPELSALGADVVLVDGPDLPRRIAEATGGAQIPLAFDCVGGGSATQDLLTATTRYGTVIVYSGMSGHPFTVSGPQLLFHGQTVIGYWVHNWLDDPRNHDKLTAIYAELAPMVANASIASPVAGVFDFTQYRQALTRAASFTGKAILVPPS
jgi:mitochondrial enoyl-[acyl-carrier protein] reductase / trans-2-enoyl-CoA reductase